MSDFQRLQAALPISHDLEVDIQAHVSFYYEVVKGLAQAENEMESLKFDLSQTESAVQEGIRQEAETSGAKTTEARIQAQVQQDALYQAAFREHLAARSRVKDWTALRDAYEARGYCFNNLTQLASRGLGSHGISSYEELRKQSAAARPKVPTRPSR